MIIRVFIALAVFFTALHAETTYTYCYYKQSIPLVVSGDIIAADSRLNWAATKGGCCRKLNENWIIASQADVQLVLKADKNPAGISKYHSRVFKCANGGEMIISPNIMLRFKSGFSTKEMESMVHGSGLSILESETGGMAGYYYCSSDLPNSDDVLNVANNLAMADELEFCEPEMIFTGCGDSELEADSSNCWALDNDGSRFGIEDIDMDIPLAWEYSTGSSDIIVVIIDVGIDLDHPDLNVGYAKNFAYDGGNGGVVNPDYDRHGTAVAGCVAALLNGSGTTGVTPGCTLASARAMRGTSDTGSWSSSTSWTVNALVWAKSIGARVTVNSNSYNYPSSSINDAYRITRDAGMVHFASAGNNGTSGLSYPGSVAGVNAISAVDANGSLASFSSYGDGLAFAAPGVSIYTTDISGSAGYVSGDYCYKNGTSFSCPLAAGVAALVLSVDSSLSPAEVETIMKNSAYDRGDAGYDLRYGNGLVNAYHAVAMAYSGACSPSDINRDRVVNLLDVAIWSAGYTGGTEGGYSLGADLNCSGSLDLDDLALMLDMWLTSD